MDIHKPKPWHGFREFLKEYLIIVVGVLTALGGEQVVENMHWRHVVAEQREALNANVQRNDMAMRARLNLEPCVQRRFAELDEIFRRHKAGKALGIVAPVSRPSYVLGGTQMWDVAVADGSLAHMPLDQKTRYMRAFSVWGSYYAGHNNERDAWMALQGLDHADELTAQDWSEMRRTLETARDADRNIQAGLRPENWMAPMHDLKLKPLSDVGPSGVHLKVQTYDAFCKPMLAG